MNRLANETSPYLLQHANNPIDWYAWGEEAFAKAKSEDKPIFLSVGYAACHWCHVLSHESFEDHDIAALMNDWFVNIKVDREERPDVDSIYMDAVVAMTGHGGWPMSVFLTPDGVPFFGGTYFPPQARGGLPGFGDVLRGVHDAWLNRRETLLKGGKDILQHMERGDLASTGAADPLRPESLQSAAEALWSQFDWRSAGWGGAPKFPQPMTIEFLLRRHVTTGDPLALEMATKTLDAMMRGGMYDQIGGGFHRYATDSVWLVPHFEKMLYDNSQLARVYLHAWQVTGRAEYRRVVEETLDYVRREMTDAGGGFYSTQDADSEGVEGKFFVWDEAEIDSALGDDGPLFKAMYGVTRHGNFEHANILHAAGDLAALAQKFSLSEADAGLRLEAARKRLWTLRERRVHPALDDKVLSGWNGLMLAAFAEAGRALGREDYLAAALANAGFLWREMRTPEGRLYRSWRQGQARLNGYLEDYAAVAEGMLALYETVFDARWFEAAQGLLEMILTHFADPRGGFFDTSDDHESLVFRPKSTQDNATPSGNALAVGVMLKLAALTGDGRYADLAETLLRQVQPVMSRYPTGFGQWLCALSFALSESREVAIVGEVNGADTRAMLSVLWSGFRPFQVSAVGKADSPVPLLHDRRQLEGKATGYVCKHFACLAPVTDVAAFKEALLDKAV